MTNHWWTTGRELYLPVRVYWTLPASVITSTLRTRTTHPQIKFAPTEIPSHCWLNWPTIYTPTPPLIHPHTHSFMVSVKCKDRNASETEFESVWLFTHSGDMTRRTSEIKRKTVWCRSKTLFFVASLYNVCHITLKYSLSLLYSSVCGGALQCEYTEQQLVSLFYVKKYCSCF